MPRAWDRRELTPRRATQAESATLARYAARLLAATAAATAVSTLVVSSTDAALLEPRRRMSALVEQVPEPPAAADDAAGAERPGSPGERLAGRAPAAPSASGAGSGPGTAASGPTERRTDAGGAQRDGTGSAGAGGQRAAQPGAGTSDGVGSGGPGASVGSSATPSGAPGRPGGSSGQPGGGDPGLPGIPALPEVPALPGVPSVPGVPDVPGLPTVPGVPGGEVPGVPGGGVPGTPGGSTPPPTLKLSDGDTAQPLFLDRALVPGSSTARCTTVTYSGDDSALVQLRVTAQGPLAHWLTVRVELGTPASSRSCTGFAPRAVVAAGTLAALADHTRLRALPSHTARPGQAVGVRITTGLPDDLPDAASGTRAGGSFVWIVD